MTHYSSVRRKTCRESLSSSRPYLPPLYPSIQNLLIITLIFVLNNMPPAHFLVFSPPPFHPFVLASFSSYICTMFHTSLFHTVLPISSPVTTTAPICLFSHRPALRPFVRPRRIPSSRLSAQVLFCCSFKRRKKDIKAGSPERQFELSENSADASFSFSVCLSLSALFVLWQDY